MEFVYFDDPGYVIENKHVHQGLTWESFQWAFTSAGEQSNWHPLTWLSHMLDIDLFGFEPGRPDMPRSDGPHLVNLLLHTANALLLFLLLRWMTGASWRSGMVAALFAVHPMHVESVAWVAERKDVLSTFLALLTLLAYVGYVKSLKRSGDLDPQDRVAERRALVSAGLRAFCVGPAGQADGGDAALLDVAVGLLALGPAVACGTSSRGNAAPAKKSPEISRAAMAKERQKGGATGRVRAKPAPVSRRRRASGVGKPRPGSCWRRSRCLSLWRFRAGPLATRRTRAGPMATAESLPFDAPLQQRRHRLRPLPGRHGLCRYPLAMFYPYDLSLSLQLALQPRVFVGALFLLALIPWAWSSPSSSAAATRPWAGSGFSA